MATNPLIPLQVQVPDIGGQFMQFTRDHNRNMQDQQRTDAIKSRAEVEREKLEAEREAAELERAQKGYTADITRVAGLAKAGRIDRAVEHLQSRYDRLVAEGRDPKDTADLLRLAQTDPEGFQKELDVEIQAARDLGLLKEAKDTSFTLGPGAKRFDAQGNEIAGVDFKPDTLSPEAEAQQIRIAERRAAASARANPANNALAQMADLRAESLRLANEKARQAITDGERKAAAAEVEAATKEKDSVDFARETLSLVNSLLTPEGREGVKSAAGPIDSKLPTLSPNTAKAETKLNTLVARLTKDNLSLLTGVISDSDIRFLQRIGSGELDLGNADEAVLDELERIQGNLWRGLQDKNEQDIEKAVEAPPESVKTFDGRKFEKRGGRWFEVK